MKISTRGRYGLRILIDIALYDLASKPRMVREIAENQGISEKYISHLIIDLRKAGFIKSIRGAGGGYRLAKYPQQIKLLDIIEVMEGTINLVNCTEKNQICQRSVLCPTKDIWLQISQEFRTVLAKYTLQDFLNQYMANGEQFLDYCI
ncbi:MAG: RrF2 family transcriptional regulator [Candidatus Bruticola sp.]